MRRPASREFAGLWVERYHDTAVRIASDPLFEVASHSYAHIGFAPHDFAQASVFYGLTGLHGAHVAVGLTLLAMVVVRSFRGHYSPEEHRGVEVPGIYWHFVDVMWVIVYSSVYVL